MTYAILSAALPIILWLLKMFGASQDVQAAFVRFVKRYGGSRTETASIPTTAATQDDDLSKRQGG